MEKEKYYTPTIEEFHVGFEFQYKNIQGIWIDLVFEANMIMNYPKENRVESIIYSWIKEDKIRVKYLDREDIEGFGFKYDVNMGELGYDSFYIEPGNDNKNRFIQYSIQNYGNGKIYLDKCINSGVNEIGFIKIKNKSEFSRLLKQLSII